MSRKSTIYGFKALDAVSAVAAQISEISEVGYLDKMSYFCKFTSASTGTFTVEGSNDDLAKTPEASRSWYELDFNTPLTVTSETEVIINLFELPFKAVRLNWSGGGTGTLTVTVASKSVGA